MIKKLGQVMIYVNDQQAAIKFWTKKVGFHLISEDNDGNGMSWYEIAPTKSAETSFVLQNKELVARLEPEVNLGAPSLLFYADNLEQVYKEFQDKNITVGDIVNVPEGKVFNFSDAEGNYFAIVEK